MISVQMIGNIIALNCGNANVLLIDVESDTNIYNTIKKVEIDNIDTIETKRNNILIQSKYNNINIYKSGIFFKKLDHHNDRIVALGWSDDLSYFLAVSLDGYISVYYTSTFEIKYMYVWSNDLVYKKTMN